LREHARAWGGDTAFKWRMTRDIVAKNTIPSCHQLWQVAVLLLSWHCVLVLNGLAAIEFPPTPPSLTALGCSGQAKKQ